ncbi:MAG: hypothetical protein JWM81_1147 [Candidatus Saccharibacteria bacterium]|nr:hypothetical protein [Candidatus Saccharibacteria bacterium]
MKFDRLPSGPRLEVEGQHELDVLVFACSEAAEKVSPTDSGALQVLGRIAFVAKVADQQPRQLILRNEGASLRFV